MRLFDYAIGNPPYQVELGSREGSTRKNYARIYDKFQILASHISLYTTMIYPISWQSNNSVNYWKIFINLGLKSSNNINGSLIFDESIESDYFVSITTFQKNYQKEVLINGDFYLPHDSEYWINSQDKYFAYHVTRNYDNYLDAPYYTSSFKNVLSLCNDITFTPFNADTFAASSGSLSKIYIKYRPSPAPDSNYWLIDRSITESNIVELDEINITINQALFIQRRWFNEICERDDLKFELRKFPPNESFGRTLMCLRSFPADAEEEANNFIKYFNTHFVKLLVSLEPTVNKFASLVPDLGDYSNNNPLFMGNAELGENHEYYNLPLNERLYYYFF